jgi:hypothetical protein
MEQALIALNSLTTDGLKEKMPFSEIMLLMISLRERLEKNDERQLMWAQSQAIHWKTHARELMKKLQEKNNV